MTEQSGASPNQVFLFSGHMIDQPDRDNPRFPPNKEPEVGKAINAMLEQLNVGDGDLAICGGACGGDLLFAEKCLSSGARLEIYIPFEEPSFLKESVSFAGEKWTKRFFAVKDHPKTKLFVLPRELGSLSDDENPYERNNQWMLSSALVHRPQKFSFLVLWDGKGGDGPGGTKHMIDQASKKAGINKKPKFEYPIPVISGETLFLYVYQR